MKRIIAVALFVLFFSQLSSAQSYNTGIGLRGGVYSGVTFKQFISSYDAFEIVGAFHYRGLFLAAMYQRHANAFDVPGLNWLYGGGVHIGFYDGRYHPVWEVAGNRTQLGVSGIVGLEYKIDEIPISIGIDLIPAIDIFESTRLWMGGGIAVRYVF
ncbi:MAG: hypothetical protein K0B09_07845 [Bacteroidales bacterium]|nr:hypothetical protein [Bacteroidales bacterium]